MNSTLLAQSPAISEPVRKVVSSSVCEGDKETEELPTFHYHRIRVKLSQEETFIPQDFLDALEDERMGRVVALDEALTHEPAK